MVNLKVILEELASPKAITIYHNPKIPNLNGIMANDDFVPGFFW